MVLLSELPPEILHNVFIHVEPPNLAWLPRVCRAFAHAISQNAPLFQQVYLRNLDAPPAHKGQKFDWIRAIQDLVRLQVICRRTFIDDKKDELSFVHDTVTSLLKNAACRNGGDGEESASRLVTKPSSRNAELLGTIFRDTTNQAAFLCRSFLYERARGESKHGVLPSPPRAEHQQSAHLHCLYGKPLLHPHPASSSAGPAGAAGHRATRATSSGNSKMRPFACSKVYDLRQYTQRTMWGPFLDDGSGRADWEKVEAIMIVLGANLRQLGLDKSPICQRVWDTPFPGVWAHSYSPLSSSLSASSQATSRVAFPDLYNGSSSHESLAGKGGSEGEKEEEDEEALNRQDPYGVAGVWLRVVCFLDYTDFFAYNFSAGSQPPPNVPRIAIDAGEATRLILMKLWVTAIEKVQDPEDGQALPVVHFKGISRSLDDSWDENANSDMRGTMGVKDGSGAVGVPPVHLTGTVRMTPEGEVRWTTFSVFAGQERWRSESIQVGGVRSARGVLGNWFDKDFDPRGPAGPTAFWKISDKGHNDNRDRLSINDFIPMVERDPEGEDEEEGDEGEDDDEEEDVEEGIEEDDDEDEDDDYELPEAEGGNIIENEGRGGTSADHLNGSELDDGSPPRATELETRDMIFTNWTERYDS